MSLKTENKNEIMTATNADQGQTWTVMAYLAGDNNLSDDMVTALKGMYELGSRNNVNIYACYDSVFPMVHTGYYDFKMTVKAQCLADCRTGEVTGENGNEPINTEVLKGFVNWCVKQDQRAADHYILILSGHGDGIREKTFLYDENPASSTTLKDLKKTLTEIREKSLGNKEIEILGIDTCFMSMLEVAYEFRAEARLMVSSQSNEPNSGWAYKPMLKALIETNGTEAGEFYAASFVKEFNGSNFDYDISGRSVDLSAIYLGEKIENLTASIGDLADCLGEELEDNSSSDEKLGKSDLREKLKFLTPQEAAASGGAVNAISDGLQFKEQIKSQVIKLILLAHWNAQTYMSDQATDICDFCACLSASCEELWEEAKLLTAPQEPASDYARELKTKLDEIIENCRQVQSAVTECVVSSCYSGYDFQYSNGISIYFPWSFLGFFTIIKTYLELDFVSEEAAGGRNWGFFLFKFLQETMRDPRGGLPEAKPHPSSRFRMFTDPPLFRGGLGIYESYFERFKNVPIIANKPDCAGQLKLNGANSSGKQSSPGIDDSSEK